MLIINGYWYIAAPASELTKKPIKRKVEGESIVLWRDSSGKPHALRDRCAHRGMAKADFDRDGDVDMIITNYKSPTHYYVNKVAKGHWLQVRLLGSKMGSTRLTTDIPWYISLYQQDRLKLDELISARYPLENINEAIADVSQGDALRNVIVF